MKVYSASEIRNIAILGHSGCGKTTVAEVALNVSGVTTRIGKVEEGNTVSDYDQEEIKRKVSISSSIIPVEWQNVKINFIDTPGYFDFSGEVKQAVAGADLALIVVSAKSGVEVGTEKAWEAAEEAGIPKMFFVNGMDDENADLDKVIEGLTQNFGKSIAPLQVPFKENGKFAGFVNVIKKEGRKFAGGKTSPCEIPAGMEDEVDTMRLVLEEAVAETSDELMDKFFEEIRFEADELQNAVSAGILQGAVTPVICGSAVQIIGVPAMLDSIVKFVPSAKELRPSVTAKNAKNDEDIKVNCDEAEPFSAFV
ncbi:MAG: GTP-binding protein, partial [Clostridiales bacterium]|nr:GTP-binding protein [Clostridiales bacterium]